MASFDLTLLNIMLKLQFECTVFLVTAAKFFLYFRVLFETTSYLDFGPPSTMYPQNHDHLTMRHYHGNTISLLPFLSQIVRFSFMNAFVTFTFEMVTFAIISFLRK